MTIAIIALAAAFMGVFAGLLVAGICSAGKQDDAFRAGYQAALWARDECGADS